MSRIHKGQPYTINLDTETTLSGATSTKIRYKKPSAETGELTATVLGETLSAQMPGSINDEAGRWYFQALVRFSGDAADTPGQAVCLKVYDDYAVNFA